jgi:hypothetical protein
MESSWNHHGIIMESSWNHHGIIMESSWNHHHHGINQSQTAAANRPPLRPNKNGVQVFKKE